MYFGYGFSYSARWRMFLYRVKRRWGLMLYPLMPKSVFVDEHRQSMRDAHALGYQEGLEAGRNNVATRIENDLAAAFKRGVKYGRENPEIEGGTEC